MSGAGSKAERKQAYFEKLKSHLDKYHKIVVVGADNVGSNQMQKIRQSLRGTAEVLMGKNVRLIIVLRHSIHLPLSPPPLYPPLCSLIIVQTMVRKVLREYVDQNPKVESLIGLVKNNVGFVFTNGDLSEVEKKLLFHRVCPHTPPIYPIPY
jgi:large subunit ribosomal protein LP0